jgi:hypothetical protein
VRRLIILLAAMAIGALLVAPAAHAEKGTSKVHVKLTGTGSGKALIDPGFEFYRGSPEIKCEYKSPGPQTGTCDTFMSDEGEGWEQVFVTAQAAPGSKFVGWKVVNAEFEGCGTFGTCGPYVEPGSTFEEEVEIIATFEAVSTSEFELEINTGGSGSGSVECEVEGGPSEPCEGKYPEGTKVALVAQPATGSEFVAWEGDCTGATCELTMNEDMSVTAIFKLEPTPPPSEFALTVALAGAGKGAVTSSPAGINCGIDCSEAYAAGTEVTLTATPASGSTFAGWSGACTGTGACKVTMSQARSVTATFEKAPTPPPAAGTAVVARTAKVKGGKAQLKLTCKGEGPCKGKLKLTAKIKSGGTTKKLTIGKASFSLAAGARVTLKVKLSGPAKKALAKGPLKAKVSGSGVAASMVKLKLAK